MLALILLSLLISQDADPLKESASSFDIQGFLLESESLLKAPSPDRLGAIGNELHRLGLDQAARAIDDAILARPTIDQLAGELLRTDFLPPAKEAIERWLQEEPSSDEALLLHAIVEHSLGADALAIRDLDQLSRPNSRQQKGASLLRRLAMHAMTRGGPQSVESNLWDIRFAGPSGYQIGSIEDTERTKWQADDAEALSILLTYRPASGYWWALLGELVNASGDPAAAKDCMARAVALKFTPRSTVEHLRALERHLKEASAKVDDQIGVPEPSPAFGWSNLASQPRTLIVLIVGGGAILFIAVLQVRAWLHR